MDVIPTFNDTVCVVCNKILHGYDRTNGRQMTHKGECREIYHARLNRKSSRTQYENEVKLEPLQRKSARLVRILEKAGIPVPPGTIILNVRWVRDIITMYKKRERMARNALIKQHVFWQMYVERIGARECVGTTPGSRLLDYHTHLSSRGERTCKWSHDGSGRAFCYVYMPDGTLLFEYKQSTDTLSFFEDGKPTGVDVPNADVPKRFKYFDIDSFRKYLKYITPFVVEALDEAMCKKYVDHYSAPPWIENCYVTNVWLSHPPTNPWSGCDGFRGNTCDGKNENNFHCHDVIDPNNPPRGYEGQRHPYTATHYQYRGWFLPTWFDGIQKPREPLPDDVSTEEIKTIRDGLESWTKAQGRILKPSGKPVRRAVHKPDPEPDPEPDVKLTDWGDDKMDINGSGKIPSYERMM